MVLSNAERQKRYRANLKKRASLDNLGVQVREAVDGAVRAAWGFFQREASNGVAWADVDGIETVEDFRASLTTEPIGLVALCRDKLIDSEGLTTHEAQAFRIIVQAYDALTLVENSSGE